MTPEPLREPAVIPDGPAVAARLMEPLLAKAAGESAEAVSITFDYGPTGAVGQAVSVEALVERATRTLVFVVGRILASDGAVLATGSAVFRKPAPAMAQA